MERYIKAVECAEIISEKFNILLGDLVDVFADIPTADVEEVKRGKWLPYIEKGTTVAGVTGDFMAGYKCSLCGRYEVEKEPYCNCGAKMNGEKSVNYESSKTERK